MWRASVAALVFCLCVSASILDETRRSLEETELQNADLQADNTWKIVAICLICWAVVTLPCVVFCATYVVKNKQKIIRRIRNRNPENLQPRGADPQAEKPCLSEETEVKGCPNSQLNQMSQCSSIRTERPEASSRHFRDYHTWWCFGHLDN